MKEKLFIFMDIFFINRELNNFFIFLCNDLVCLVMVWIKSQSSDGLDKKSKHDKYISYLFDIPKYYCFRRIFKRTLEIQITFWENFNLKNFYKENSEQFKIFCYS